MPKPRIIIADTEYQYIIPLQMKFAEEYFEKVDLEIITDQEYFREFLSTPQRADVLIISEELYDQSIQRHSFSYVFVMTEDQDSDGETGGSVLKIFKYTNIKEIFNKITGRSADKLNVQTGSKKSQIVVVCSASGGSGKTTIAMGISSCLSKNYRKVLYLNADQLQTFQRLMADQSPIMSAKVYQSLEAPDHSIFSELQPELRQEGFYYLPPFKAALMSLGLKYKLFAYIADSAKKGNLFDYIILDVNSGLDDNLAFLMKIADKVIIVDDESASSIYATNRFIANIDGISSEKFMFICNNCTSTDYGNSRGRKYQINEFVGHIDNYDSLGCDDFSKDGGMQKVAFLLI